MNRKNPFKYLFMILLCCLPLVTACSKEENPKIETIETVNLNNTETEETSYITELEDNKSDKIIDLSAEFDNLSGCAIVYFPNEITYIYNEEIVDKQTSPLSTFKIISTLIGLDKNVLGNETSTMEYSGIQYPVSEWNGELTLQEAFQTSCIWYFKQVLESVGQSEVQSALENLHYGNCDSSEWNGSGINNLPELNGFWLDSSLKISPREQVDVLADIFEGNTDYSMQDIQILKSIMLTKADETCAVYGKTGSSPDGKAWFVGFIETNNQKGYFAVYLDDEQNVEQITGSRAREIAISILEKVMS